MKITCGLCKGKGRIGNLVCWACHGRGWFRQVKTAEERAKEGASICHHRGSHG